MDSSRKRKLGIIASTSSRKKLKRTHPLNNSASHKVKKTTKQTLSLAAVTADDLPWKTISAQGDVGGFGDNMEGGILTLEEVEGVEVVYGDGDGGKIVGFRVCSTLALSLHNLLTER